MDSHEENKGTGEESLQDFNASSEPIVSNLGRFRVSSVPMETDVATGQSANLLGATCKRGVSPEPEDKNHLSPPRLVCSTSLKNDQSQKRKKVVRFADASDLKLMELRRSVKSDNAPVMAAAAFADLKLDTAACHPPFNKSGSSSSPPEATACAFVPKFKQPKKEPNFLARLRCNLVCLENTIVYGHRVALEVKVMNISYHKAVQARYTTDSWLSFTNIDLLYVSSSIDVKMDNFKCIINVPQASPGDTLSFVIRYVVNGEEFWDNNDRKNYTLVYEISKT